MKTHFLTIGLLLAALLSAGADATLIKQGNCTGQVVYDTETNFYWIQNLNAFTNQNYQEQINNINTNFASTNYFGINNWHMAKNSEFSSLNLAFYANMMDLLYFEPTDTWGSRSTVLSWDGRIDYPVYRADPMYVIYGIYADLEPDGSLSRAYTHGDVVSDFGSPRTGAWVVGTAPAPVPEPSTLLLFGAGLAGMVYFMKRVRV